MGSQKRGGPAVALTATTRAYRVKGGPLSGELTRDSLRRGKGHYNVMALGNFVDIVNEVRGKGSYIVTTLGAAFIKRTLRIRNYDECGLTQQPPWPVRTRHVEIPPKNQGE